MELLIVIGVLGILAAGLLAAIDPFEQLKKARDSNYRSAAIELLSATQRYYANHGYFPWTNDGQCETDTMAHLDPTKLASGSADTLAMGGDAGFDNFTNCLTDLINDGELKSTFSQGLNTTVFLSTWGKTSVRVCYMPESKSNRADKSTNMSVSDTEFAPLNMGCTVEQREAGECVQCFQ